MGERRESARRAAHAAPRGPTLGRGARRRRGRARRDGRRRPARRRAAPRAGTGRRSRRARSARSATRCRTTSCSTCRCSCAPTGGSPPRRHRAPARPSTTTSRDEEDAEARGHRRVLARRVPPGRARRGGRPRDRAVVRPPRLRPGRRERSRRSTSTTPRWCGASSRSTCRRGRWTTPRRPPAPTTCRPSASRRGWRPMTTELTTSSRRARLVAWARGLSERQVLLVPRRRARGARAPAAGAGVARAGDRRRGAVRRRRQGARQPAARLGSAALARHRGDRPHRRGQRLVHARDVGGALAALPPGAGRPARPRSCLPRGVPHPAAVRRRPGDLPHLRLPLRRGAAGLPGPGAGVAALRQRRVGRPRRRDARGVPALRHGADVPRVRRRLGAGLG